MQFRVRTLLTISLVICLSLGAIGGWQLYFGPTRSGVSAAVANRKLWSGYQLPRSASDVTYYVDSGGCEAEFSIPESDLLALCRDRGWDVEPIAAPVAYFKPVLLPDDARLVSDGF